jgi:hypothetical protein
VAKNRLLGKTFLCRAQTESNLDMVHTPNEIG